MKFSHQKTRFTFLILILLLVYSYKGSAQRPEPINSDQGDVIRLHSKILGEDRQIMIYTPTDSINPETRYPVVYILDPDNHFRIMIEYSKYLSHEKVRSAPPLIVVGIMHNDRIRDLTPSPTKYDYSGFWIKDNLSTGRIWLFKMTGNL